MKYNIPFIKPTFPDADQVANDFRSIVESNWFTNFGPFEKKFSDSIKKYLGHPEVEAVTVSNATVGIDLAVRALFLEHEAKKEVLVPSFTFAAGPEVLISHNLVPVFIDIDKKTWQPDVEKAKKYLESHSSSVVGVLLGNSFGVGSPGVEDWERICDDYSLPLIIDSAAGFGSEYGDGSKVGTKGTCEVFSFHATKPFAIGEGGAITTKDKSLAAKLRQIENFGFNEDKVINSIGTNAKLQEISCAIGLRQLEVHDDWLKIRRGLLKNFKNEVGDKVGFQSNDSRSTIPFISVVMKDEDSTSATLSRLNGAGIMARKYYAPLHNQSLIMKYSKRAGSLEVTEDIYSRIIALPLHNTMTEAIVKDIAEFL